MYSIMRSLSLMTVGLLLILPGFGVAQVSEDGLWTDTTDRHSDAGIDMPVAEGRFSLSQLNFEVLNTLLTRAPAEDDVSSALPLIISMPVPSGEYINFELVESAIMESALAAKFPELRTFRGFGVDDASASLRLSLTPKGLHGQILAAGKSIYIDPAPNVGEDQYISYRKRDYQPPSDEPRQCLVDDDHQSSDALREDAQRVRHGDIRRAYRLALATTGEYTQFHGGTVANAMAAVVVTMNRVNGIYERDVGVRMVLVANNDRIIYTSSSQDPYSNGDGGAMLGQNQSNLDRIIGSNNYDIGHVFSTGGGGVAFLNSPCNNRKAGGVTGQRRPVGDPFDVDFVAHEMGHQFGANHTFNGTQGSCFGGNRNSSTAYEPGSGTTIMGYAGICRGDNIQLNSDDHFHAASLEEIVNFITGSGNACAVGDQTDNLPPSADAGPTFTIPVNTPFELTGSATDENGDDLTYTWEQFDKGRAGSPNSPSGNAPIFRSFSPSASATRTFPQLSDLLGGTQTFGELLPSYARTLNFWLTVRDNHPAGGGIDQDAVQIDVNASAGPFRITAPNTSVSWSGASTQTVTWNQANTDRAPINCSNVDILLSDDGGNTFTTTVANTIPNDGIQEITVPNRETGRARLKIKCSDNIFFDVTDADFTITASSTESPTVTIAASDPTATEAGSTKGTITISRTGDSAAPLTVNYNVGGSATAGIDYLELGGTVTIPAGSDSVNIDVSPIDDSDVENDETVILTLSLDSQYTIGASAQATITIISDDRATPLGSDLLIDTVSTTADPIGPGAKLNYSVEVINQGRATAGTTFLRLVLSTDPVIDGDDLRLSRPSPRVPELTGGARHQVSGTVQISANTLPGNYFLGAIVDPGNAVTEADETNNTKGAAITVSGLSGDGPDLVVSALTTTANVVSAGAQIRYTVNAQNRGTDSAGVNFLRLVLSADTTISRNDQRLTRPSLPVPTLTAGGSHEISGTVTIPEDMAPGDYLLGAIIDPSRRVAETDESNNISSGVAITVTASTRPQ